MIQRTINVKRFVLLAAILLIHVYPPAAGEICTDCGQDSGTISTDIDCTRRVWDTGDYWGQADYTLIARREKIIRIDKIKN